MFRFLYIGACLVIASCAETGYGSRHRQDHTEKLFIRQLPQGRTLAHFEFVTAWDTHHLTWDQPSNVHHYGLFPKSLAEVMSHYGTQEVHLTLTQGIWRTRLWGYPPISAPLGAELWAWFLPDTNAEQQWRGLVNAMSGLLCASLNFIESTATYQPLHSFKPWGAVVGNVSSSQLRYASLPREAVCTENFTPWTKLLPCGTKAGLGSLLVPSNIYDTEYHSLGLHFTSECVNENCSLLGVRLLQSLTVVFQPSPKPKLTMKSLFTKSLLSSCPLASVSRVAICLTPDLNLTSSPTLWEDVEFGRTVTRWAVYDIANLTAGGSKFEISANVHTSVGMPWAPSVLVHRFITGGNRERRGITTELSNTQQTSVDMLYLTMVPWFCRLFLHTLTVTSGTLLYQHYTPAKDRVQPHTLELLVRVPPHSTVTVSLQFSPAFLKWTEHPPDAHHGFYINSAVATTVMASCPNCTVPSGLGARYRREVMVRLHTEPLLVPLPTPDFSMPYNVLCFVCTVVSIGFGSIFNLTTRQLVPDIAENKKKLKIFGKNVDRSFVTRVVLVLAICGIAAYSYLNPQ